MISILHRVLPLLLLSILDAKAFRGGVGPCVSSRQSVFRPCPIATTPNSVQHYRFEPLTTRFSEPVFFSLSALSDSNANQNVERPQRTTPTSSNKKNRVHELISTFTLWTPLWTILACAIAVWRAPLCSKAFGSLPVLQSSYWALMMTMGLAISKNDVDNLQRTSPRILLWNAILCFLGMPLLAVGIARACQLSNDHTIGLVVLGSVGGGQASNLFSLLAGGNVALSVLCTISTTLLGVLATPVLLDKLLGAAVGGSSLGATLKSILSLVLFPLLVGSTLSRNFPAVIQKFSNFFPVAGVLATLLLVVGGSSNSFLATKAAATSVSWSAMAGVLLPSCALGILGGLAALGLSNLLQLERATKKTLVVETLSKSPTLAYLLARKHFGIQSALVPGGAMVTLAVLGALVASVWSRVDTIIGDEPTHP